MMSASTATMVRLHVVKTKATKVFDSKTSYDKQNGKTRAFVVACLYVCLVELGLLGGATLCSSNL